MKKLVFIWIVSVIGMNIYSQCNSRLMEQAAAQSGTDALYIRDFRVKLDEGTMKRPSPVGRFQVFLNEGIRYRFNVANASEYEGKAILQLYDRNRMVGSTFDTERKSDEQLFDYECNKTGSYQVLMSFSEGKRGCAVGVMSMILSDSMTVPERKTAENDLKALESLYLGIDNELNIAATNIPGGSLQVSISQGSITGSDGRYIARVEKKGIVTVRVTAMNKNGRVSEKDSMDFMVRDLPLPIATLDGLYEGMINMRYIDRITEIKLENPIEAGSGLFTVIEFSIFKENNLNRGEVSYSSKLTPSQKSLIKNLNAGERFIIRDIYVRGPDGATHLLKPLSFILE